MHNRSVQLTIAIVLTSFLAAVASVASPGHPWSLLGDARAVKEGTKPNPWAIELTSKCPEGNQTCLSDNTLTYSGVSFNAPAKDLTFRDLYRLSTSYRIKEGDCGGGSPRFSIGVDTDEDGKVNGHIFIYIGSPPGFTGCSADTWESTGNLIGDAEARFDVSQLVPGTSYMGYDDALGTLGALAEKPVPYVLLVADGGWFTNQVVLVDNVRVNNFKLTAKGFRKK